MIKFLTTLIAVALVAAGFAGVAAQDVETSYAEGLNAPVTWSDNRGDVMASLQVTEVNPDWMDYEDGRGPDRNFVYQTVSIAVTNNTGDDWELSANSFSLVDAYGRVIRPSHVNVAEDVDYELLRGSVTVAQDETSELVLMYELPAGVDAGLLVWDQGSGKGAIVNLMDAPVADSAIASDLATTSSWTDDRGTLVATLQVTDVNPDWLEYADRRAPNRGEVYQAVSFTITNESGDTLAVNPNDFSLMDSSGASLRISRTEAAEGAGQQPFDDAVELAPGESVDGMLVYLNSAGLDPVALSWAPMNGLIHLVVFQDGAESTETTVPESTPATVPESTPIG